jgi:glycosyltransferase involved in cell wall biosynthesis
MKQLGEVREKLSSIYDDILLLPSKYSGSMIRKGCYKFAGTLYIFQTGLKFSNYVIGEVEFTPARLESVLGSRNFDCVLFEYWHARKSIPLFHKKGISCVLDMHDILWQSYKPYLDAKTGLPNWWKQWAFDRYKMTEEQAWTEFDGIIAINAEEKRYVMSVISNDSSVFYAPMGTDLELWSYSWEPAHPPRIAYYGALGNSHRQREAIRCYDSIMPEIWKSFPETELWLIGSDPPASLRALEGDPRVRVTGYVERVQDIIRTMAVVVCPFSGTYGFRSRIIEVMALGIPVVVSPDAVYGMGMDVGRGILMEETDKKMAQTCIDLLRNPEFARRQSQQARAQVEEKFSLETTYGQLARNLFEFCCDRKVKDLSKD